jgi:hypothetical protein
LAHIREGEPVHHVAGGYALVGVAGSRKKLKRL